MEVYGDVVEVFIWHWADEFVARLHAVHKHKDWSTRNVWATGSGSAKATLVAPIYKIPSSMASSPQHWFPTTEWLPHTMFFATHIFALPLFSLLKFTYVTPLPESLSNYSHFCLRVNWLRYCCCMPSQPIKDAGSPVNNNYHFFGPPPTKLIINQMNRCIFS